LTDWAIPKLPRAILALTISLLAWGQTSTPEVSLAPPRIKVVLDPGHGGEDTGALGRTGLKEKEAALDLARKLRSLLEKAGFDVLMTREDDTFVPLWDRARWANAQEADLFVSLHLNAARARAAKGSEVYFLSLDQGDADAAEVAALENAGAGEAPGPEGVLADILKDLAQKAYLRASEQLAESILVQLNRLGGIKQRGVKQAPFVVLRGAAMPAVLVEVAFLSNPREERRLKDEAFRKRVVEAIALGVRRFVAASGGTPRRRTAERLYE